MSLVFGYANPALQRVLLELCFSDEARNPAFRQPRLKLLDQALSDDILSGEQLRVLPLLYRTVPIDGMSSKSFTKVIGIYKHTFCRNNLMLHRLGEVKVTFEQAGFLPMIGLKGLPAITYLNKGIGARPMADVDVLIPRMHEHPERSLSILHGLGYVMKAASFRSLTMISPERLELDMHWYVQDWALGQDLVDVISQHASTKIFHSQSFLIPCLEHHLAHTIAHGILTKTLTYDARWVFDTVAVLRCASSLNTERFAEFANKIIAPQRIRNALAAIATELPESIQIDREQLFRLHDAVNSNSKTVSWLYDQKPTPNLSPEQLVGTPGMDRIKAMLISYIWLPKHLRKHQDLSFLGYLRWLGEFPPLNHRQAAWRFVRKLIFRGPVLIYRVILQK